MELHGNAERKECVAAGSNDDNVYDIRQGVAIYLLVRLPKRR